MRLIQTLVISLAGLFISQTSYSNELIIKKSEALRQGYAPYVNSNLKFSTTGASPSELPRGLNWPVQFEDGSHSMGNSMLQYQNYDGESYFHGGCDLRAQSGQIVAAPVSGKLYGGYYSYVTNQDGSLTKYMKPWPQTGERLYFELNITTENGYVFEFHHVDPQSLPTTTLTLLNQGGGMIQAGTAMGRVVTWPVAGADGTYYHHVHYNIVDPTGVRLNPEYYSQQIPDTTPPQIHKVFAIFSNRAEEISGSINLPEMPTEVVVATTDRKNTNVYIQPPVYLGVFFVNGLRSELNFSERLASPSGTQPALQLVYQERLTTSSGNVYETEGNYQNNFFLFRLKTPTGAAAPFRIIVKDQAGNQATF